jgi:hypothetical protein
LSRSTQSCASGEQTAQRPEELGGAMMISVEPQWRQASP